MQLPLAVVVGLASSISNVAAAVNCDGRTRRGRDGQLLLGRAIDGAAPVMLRAKPPVQRCRIDRAQKTGGGRQIILYVLGLCDNFNMQSHITSVGGFNPLTTTYAKYFFQK